ncbi:unnamed protein product [Prorocentrum cordatum]|uniref:Uncharacterized protein n=1 Tax=Prorocentrum cordatum TaxID=2364126 RepID=A0ABN9RHT7_9DINO|nr:unnamed protein product [Polarella glacialis]
MVRGGGIPVRHGSCVAHVRSVQEAAELMAKLGGQGEMQQLKEFQSVLDEAQGCLGLDRKVQTEDVRRGLVQRGQNDLAKDFVLWRQGWRAVAHPPAASLPQKVLQALRKPLMEGSGGGISMESASSEDVALDEESELFKRASSKSTSTGAQPKFFDIGSEEDVAPNPKVLEDIKDILLTLRADILSLLAPKVNQSTMTIAGEVMAGGASESAGAAKDEQASDQYDGLSTEEASEVGSFNYNAASALDLKPQPPPGAAPQTGVELEGAQEESAGAADGEQLNLRTAIPTTEDPFSLAVKARLQALRVSDASKNELAHLFATSLTRRACGKPPCPAVQHGVPKEDAK